MTRSPVILQLLPDGGAFRHQTPASTQQFVQIRGVRSTFLLHHRGDPGADVEELSQRSDQALQNLIALRAVWLGLHDPVPRSHVRRAYSTGEVPREVSGNYQATMP